jgi:copper chaperone
MIEIYTFEVIGPQRMACEGCEHAVQRSLARLPGVRQVHADHYTQHIVVQVDATLTTVSDIKTRLGTLGYQLSQLS